MLSRTCFLILLHVSACASGERVTLNHSGDGSEDAVAPPPYQEIADNHWLLGRQSTACELGEASGLRPAVRAPDVERIAPLDYPPTIPASARGSVDDAHGELAQMLDLRVLRMSLYGGYVERLCTATAELGANERCRFGQGELERWADFVSVRADHFGIDRPFRVSPGEDETKLYVTMDGEPWLMEIAKLPQAIGVCVEGHFWPGVAVPDNTMTAAQLRARAPEHRRIRREAGCGGHPRCRGRDRAVDLGALQSRDIERIVLRWTGRGNREGLQVRLIAELIVRDAMEVCVDATTHQSCADVLIPSHYVMGDYLPDYGAAVLGPDVRPDPQPLDRIED